jgi:hypothetical protein
MKRQDIFDLRSYRFDTAFLFCVSQQHDDNKMIILPQEILYFGERRLQIDPKLSTAHQNWLRACFKMGGTYSNFALEIHTYFG